MSQQPETPAPNIRTLPPPAPSGQGRGNSLGAEIAQHARAIREAVSNTWLIAKLSDLANIFIAYAVPRLQLLDGETIQLEIRQAPYRSAIPNQILRYWWLIVSSSLALTCLLAYLAIQARNSPLLAAIGFFPLTALAWAVHERLCYEQWRLIITNLRTIIYMPDPRSSWRVDTIRMGGAKKITVVDVNFSRSAWWGMFQTWTGARDLVISISGYAFKEGRAEVQGGLTIPDVMPQDIRKLEEKIFK